MLTPHSNVLYKSKPPHVLNTNFFLVINDLCLVLQRYDTFSNQYFYKWKSWGKWSTYCKWKIL